MKVFWFWIAQHHAIITSQRFTQNNQNT